MCLTMCIGLLLGLPLALVMQPWQRLVILPSVVTPRRQLESCRLVEEFPRYPEPQPLNRPRIPVLLMFFFTWRHDKTGRELILKISSWALRESSPVKRRRFLSAFTCTAAWRHLEGSDTSGQPRKLFSLCELRPRYE